MSENDVFNKYPERYNAALEMLIDFEFPASKRMEIIGDIILIAQARQKGIVKNKYSYNLRPIEYDLIIDDMADFFLKFGLNLWRAAKQPKRKKKEKVFPEEGISVLEKALPEIEEIYFAVKVVGFSSRLVDAESKWRSAALKRYDDSRRGYKFIKREYLEDEGIYRLTAGQEKRDFEGKLLQKVIKDNKLGRYGIQLLRGIVKNIDIDMK